MLHTAKARAKEMLCSESYMDNHQVLIVPANSKIKSLKDITKDTEVGIQSGSTAADAADSVKELKNSKIKLLADNVQILNDLGHGLDAAVMDEVVAKYYTKKDAGKYKVLDIFSFLPANVISLEQLEKMFLDSLSEISNNTNWVMKKLLLLVVLNLGLLKT